MRGINILGRLQALLQARWEADLRGDRAASAGLTLEIRAIKD